MVDPKYRKEAYVFVSDAISNDASLLGTNSLGAKNQTVPVQVGRTVYSAVGMATFVEQYKVSGPTSLVSGLVYNSGSPTTSQVPHLNWPLTAQSRVYFVAKEAIPFLSFLELALAALWDHSTPVPAAQS